MRGRRVAARVLRHGRPIVVGTLAVVCGAACDSPAAPTRVATIVIAPAASSLTVGATLALAATARDAAGNPISGRALTWATSNAAVATISSTGVLTGIAPGAMVATASSDGQSATAPITVLPVPVASLTISPGSAAVIAGATQQFTATARDANVLPLAGRAIAWSIASPGTAIIDATGLLTAIAPGTTTVTATSEGKNVTASVNVLPVPVDVVVVTPATATVVAGLTQQLAVVTRDAAGHALTGRLTTWSSSSSSIATVDNVGLLTAVGPGIVSITATSEGRTGSSLITVTPGAGGPIITSIVPGTLQPGTSVTINGVGFGTTNTGNVVTIGGVVAPLVSVTATQLVIAVPCVESGNASVRVTSNGVAGNPLTRPVVVPQQTLAVGQAVVATNNAASVCNELLTTSAHARYLIAAFSASTTQASQVDFELTGNTPVGAAPPPRVDARRSAGMLSREAPDAEAVRDRAHFADLERDRLRYQQLRARAAREAATRPRDRAGARPSVSAAVPPPALGDERSFFYTLGGGCNDTTRVVRGKVIYAGTRAVIWEDSANTLQSSKDANLSGYYQRLGQIFDTDQYESVKNNFGDPLLRDAATDNDGRVHMVFTQRLSGSGTAAYVTSCDQFARSTSPGSNFGQFFYGSVPTTSALNLNSTASPDGWFYFMARTVVHEVKHIAAISARIANNSPSSEQSWLEEGTARHAEELWVRESLHKVAWKANTGFGTAATNGVYCDFTPADATCNAIDPLRRPGYGMRRHFNEIREKLLAPWDWSPYGDASGQSSSTFYQTTWSLVRYAIDRFAVSDASFLRALVNATTTGTTNLSSVAGVSMDQLIGGWGLALFADDYPGIPSPSADIQFPTWNLRSIYAGLNSHTAWSSRWNTPFPIQPTQLGFGSFVSMQAGLRGGAHAYFEISGAARSSQLVGVRSASGGLVPSNLRVAIVRLQ